MTGILYQALVAIGFITLVAIVMVIVFSIDRDPPAPVVRHDDKVLQLIDDLWDFDDPVASEARFREAHATAATPTAALELQTQIARAQGLQRNFDDALATLDDVQRAEATTDDRVRIRMALERGRVHNTARDRDRAKPLFEQAWQLARDARHDALAVDAAHMLAIVAEGDDALTWNTRALELAEASADPRARRWRASLHNNIGWTHHERGDFDTALHHFQLALGARKQHGTPREVLIARWCVARCLRSLNRIDEALAEQQALLEAWQELGESDGYVHEELAECLTALGRADEAEPHMARARKLLSRD